MRWLAVFLAWSFVVANETTNSPTHSPSITVLPTSFPTSQPSGSSHSPSVQPSISPSAPSSQPSAFPSAYPSSAPSFSLSSAPSSAPSFDLSGEPTSQPSGTAPTSVPVYCGSSPAELNVPGRVQYSTSEYPTSFRGCQWNLHAGVGNFVKIDIQSHISVLPTYCNDFGYQFCVGYTDGKCDQTALVAYCGEHPCMNNLALQKAVSRVETPSNATSSLCPLTCHECKSCNYNYVLISDANGVELHRSCGLKPTLVTVVSNTSDVTVRFVRGFLQRLKYRDTNDSYVLDDGLWASAVFSAQSLAMGPDDYLNFTWNVTREATSGVPAWCSGVVQIGTAPGQITPSGTYPYYANNANCTWIITAPTGQYVSLKFPRFSLQPSFDGTFRDSPQATALDNFADYITIRDGPSNTLRGPFAGIVSPGNITSVSQSFEIHFRSDDKLIYEGFAIEYEFVSTPGTGPRFCSGSVNLTLPGEVILDGTYPSNSRCTWFIIAPPTQFVKIEWKEFSLEGNFTKCIKDKSDYVKVETSSGQVLQYLCGEVSQIPSLTSTGNIVKVSFVSDSFVSGAGFRFVYSFVNEAGKAPASCAGAQVVRASANAKGAIGDGLLTGRSDNPARACTWIVSAPAGAVVHFHFVRILVRHCPQDLEYTNNVGVYDGQGISGPHLADVCGSALPPPSVSSTNAMTINFVGDGGDDGFFGFYEIKMNSTNSFSCAGVQAITSANGNNGVLESGNSGSRTSSDCTWKITAPPGQFVQLQLVTMAVGVGIDGCKQKWVGGFDGEDDKAWPFFSTCGSATFPSPMYVSTGSSVTVRYVDVDGDVATNFRIVWKFVAQPGDHSAHCWNEVVGNPVVGSSTSYTPVVNNIVEQQQGQGPFFRKGLWCAWKVEPGANRIVQIKWRSALWSGVNFDAGYCGDYVQISSDPGLLPNPSSNHHILCSNAGRGAGAAFEQALSVPADSIQFSGPVYIRLSAYQDLQFSIGVRIFNGPVIEPEERDASSGLIAGIVVLALVGVFGLLGLCCYYDHWKKNKRSGNPADFDLATGQNLRSVAGSSSFDFGRSDGHQRMYSENDPSTSSTRPTLETI